MRTYERMCCSNQGQNLKELFPFGSEFQAKSFTMKKDHLIITNRQRNASSFHPCFIMFQECFDPRERFKTERGVSGTPHLLREELEIYGVIACCPQWRKAPGPSKTQVGPQTGSESLRGVRWFFHGSVGC